MDLASASKLVGTGRDLPPEPANGRGTRAHPVIRHLLWNYMPGRGHTQSWRGKSVRIGENGLNAAGTNSKLVRLKRSNDPALSTKLIVGTMAGCAFLYERH